MKGVIFVVGLLILHTIAVNPNFPTQIPNTNFDQASHIVSSFENNVTKTNSFLFDCPYNDDNITIKYVSYKVQSNSSNFTVVFFNSDANNVNESKRYWQMVKNDCSYYCEANYTLIFNATRCFIFNGFDSYNDTMLISYEIVEEYVGPMPESPVPSPPSIPENPNPPNNDEPSSQFGPGVIAGIVLGSLGLLALLGAITFYFVKKYDMCGQNVAHN